MRETTTQTTRPVKKEEDVLQAMKVVLLCPMKDHSGDVHPTGHGGLPTGAGGHALQEAAFCGDFALEQETALE